uniref:Uncharacterized protein n=1 Tax=Caenorhabditis japonica TaxID=281687 RepID=A0A8R1DMZ7_CAEJA
MADKKDYAAIAELEKQIAENAARFEKWKLGNHLQRGTIEYKDGVRQFEDWDRDLRARVASLHGINVESGPKNIDAVLDELLDKVDVTGFVLAIETVNSSDPTFYPSFVQAFQNHQRNPLKPDIFRTMAAARPQFYPGFAASPYSYAAPQATPVYMPPPVVQIPRPVSPIRDFQKKAGAPFRDFSV